MRVIEEEKEKEIFYEENLLDWREATFAFIMSISRCITRTFSSLCNSLRCCFDVSQDIKFKRCRFKGDNLLPRRMISKS